VLWLFGPEHQVTEVGAMNIFFLLRHPTEPDSYELVTPPLHKGDILAGTCATVYVECMDHYTVHTRTLT
jgi:branched-subunit amino acid aminotransferase/4-amino-4-deoxychorismate lyase